MIKYLAYFFTCALLCTQGLTHAQSVPAVRVAYATQSTMLAATRAGSRVVAVGDHGVVLLSDDDGKNFRQAQLVPSDFALTSVSFVDAKLGWAVGHAGQILHTTDGGEHWAQQRIDFVNDRPLFAVHFWDASHGVAVGLWSLILTTHDGGKSWATQMPPVPAGAKKADLNLLGLFADAQGHVYVAAERGMVLRSDDQGQTWRYLSTGYKGSFWSGLACADGSLLLAGQRGSLYRSTDEGGTWSRIETHSHSSITGLASRGTQVAAVGLDGLLLTSQDCGGSFSAQTRADRATLTALLLSAGPQLILFSRQGLLK